MKKKSIPRITAFLIPGKDSSDDSGIKTTDKCMLIPFVLIKKMIKETKESGFTQYCFYDYIQNKWIIEKQERDIPPYIEDEIILKIKKGKVCSHKYFATI